MLAYNVAMCMNDALLVEHSVRPIPGPDGKLIPDMAAAEFTGVAQQEMLAVQFERLAAPEVLPVWHRFLADPSGADGANAAPHHPGHRRHAGPRRAAQSWDAAMQARLDLMAPVLAQSAATLRRTVADLEMAAGRALAGYACLVLVSFVHGADPDLAHAPPAGLSYKLPQRGHATPRRRSSRHRDPARRPRTNWAKWPTRWPPSERAWSSAIAWPARSATRPPPCSTKRNGCGSPCMPSVTV